METAKANPQWNLQQIADDMGVNESTVRRGLKRAGFNRKDVHDYLPEFKTPALDRPITTIGKIGVAADWHLPLCDYEYANRMIDRFVDLEIKTLVIPGDFWNMDALSQYEPKQTTANFEREKYEGEKVLDRLLDIFERIVLSRGNHDFRFARKLGYQLQFKHAIAMLFGDIDPEKKQRLEVSNLDYVWNRPYEGASDYDSTYITHPENYSSIPLAVARELAGKVGANVFTAHSHHAAKGHAKNGYHVVCELGGLHDKNITAYLQNTTKFSNWNQGYAWIDGDNIPHMSSPRWGD